MFTSRLPVSTVRRPTTNPNDGSTSFGGSIKRQTNIPVTVRKANLFTPQTSKQRPLSFGASTAAKSLFNTDKKYQRPSKQLPDKDQQTKMFENLVEFMKTNAPHLPPPDARKFFSSISTTESTRIFQCLIEKILPDFRINRLETDVPEALTMIGYPFIRSVTKSSLISVTTRQAAVGLLFIFQWLMDEIAKEKDHEDVEFDKLSVIDHAFSTVLLQPEDIEQAAHGMLNKIWPMDDPSDLIREVEQTEDELEELAEELDKKDVLLNDEQVVTDDIAKCQKYRDELQLYIETNRAEEDEVRQESQKLDIKYDETKREIEKSEALIRDHHLTEAEAEDLMKKDNEAQVKLDLIVRQKEDATLELKNSKTTRDKKFTESEEVKRESLNSLLDELQLYESPLLFYETPVWQDRRQAYHDFISKFKMLTEAEAPRELTLFRQEMMSTFSKLREELLEGESNMEKEMTQSQNLITKYKTEILPDMTEELKQANRAKEMCESEEKGIDSTYRKQEEDLSMEDVKIREELQAKVLSINKEQERQLKLLQADKLSNAETLELRKKSIESTIARVRQEKDNIIKATNTLLDEEMEIYQIAQENHQTIKGTKFRKLSKKLSEAKFINV